MTLANLVNYYYPHTMLISYLLINGFVIYLWTKIALKQYIHGQLFNVSDFWDEYAEREYAPNKLILMFFVMFTIGAVLDILFGVLYFGRMIIG